MWKWKMRLWKCEFCPKWDCQNVNIWINCGFLSQCEDCVLSQCVLSATLEKKLRVRKWYLWYFEKMHPNMKMHSFPSFLVTFIFLWGGKKRRKCSSGWRIHHRNGKRANERERAKAPTNSIIVIVTIRIEWKYWVWQDSHFRTTYLATQQLFTLSCVSLQCMDLYTLAEKKGLFPSISCPLLAAQWCKNPDFGIWSIFQKRNDLIHLWFWILWNLFWVLYLLLDFDPILVRFLNIFFPNVCRKLECFIGKERFFDREL